jgi:rubredoxin
MWWLLHYSGGTRCVPGGESFVETCPECKTKTRFDEVEVSESLGVFFVDVVSDKERKFRCRSCECVFDRKDDGTEAPAQAALPPPPQKSAKQLAREERDRKELAESKANRIEDELAELKKRLGR